MTTIAVPPTGSPAWREIYQSPPDVQTGRWCPIDDTTLKIRLDGYGCPACGAAWDFHGRAGRWLADTAAVAVVAPAVRWRPSEVLVLAGVAGCAVTAAVLVLLLGVLGERLQWWPAAMLAVLAAAVPAYAWVARKVDDWPYRHNRVIGPVDRDGEVTL
jgi:hypothetical protein